MWGKKENSISYLECRKIPIVSIFAGKYEWQARVENCANLRPTTAGAGGKLSPEKFKYSSCVEEMVAIVAWAGSGLGLTWSWTSRLEGSRSARIELTEERWWPTPACVACCAVRQTLWARWWTSGFWGLGILHWPSLCRINDIVQLGLGQSSTLKSL